MSESDGTFVSNKYRGKVKVIDAMLRMIIVLLFGCTLSSCGWMNDDKGIFVNRSDDYLQAEQAPPLVVPNDLSDKTLQDSLAIPQLDEQPRTVFYSHEAPRPNPVFARENGQQVKIQKLGEERWLVVAQKPSIVWPKVKQFLADNGVSLAGEDPQQGTLKTQWLELESDAGYRDIVRSLLLTAKISESAEGGRDRLYLRVEQGLRIGSTEIYVRQENDEQSNSGSNSWPESSSLQTIEAVLLNELGAYIAADVTQRAESKQATELASRKKAEIFSDNSGDPFLRFNLDFNRAWAVVGQALNNAEINVTDLDRSAGIFYVDITAEDLVQDKKSGFIKNLFSFGSKDDSVTLQIHLVAEDEAQVVRIYKADDQLAKVDISQQLLTLLRDFAG
ncbi:MAG: outer membrane protein assembly factor BamC [Pseudomonadales bacterium]|nr:outer membrane protein assembly factor BamC [Pseudomonadales bacterium]